MRSKVMFGKATCSSHFSHTLASCFCQRPLGILGLTPALQRTLLAEEGHLYSITFRQPTPCLPQVTTGDGDGDQAAALGAGQGAGKLWLTWPEQTPRGSPREPQLISLPFRCCEHRGTACKKVFPSALRKQHSAKMGGDGSFGALAVKKEKLAKKCVFRKIPQFCPAQPWCLPPPGVPPCSSPISHRYTLCTYICLRVYIALRQTGQIQGNEDGKKNPQEVPEKEQKPKE